MKDLRRNRQGHSWSIHGVGYRFEAPAKTDKSDESMNNLKVEKALVVLNDMDTNVIASAANIPTVKTAQTNELNVFDALKYDKVVVTKAALATIEEVYA